MKKTMGIIALGLLAVPGQLWAADNDALAKQIQELIEQNRMLQERVLSLSLEKMVCQETVLNLQKTTDRHSEKGLAKKPSGPSVDSINERLIQVERILEAEIIAPAAEQPKEYPMGKLEEFVEFGGLVEVEASSSASYGHEETSDLSLATVELGMDVHVSDWSHAHLVLLYEEGEENDHLVIDEGAITLGNSEKVPVALTVGKIYLPFGLYLSSMVSAPLTLALGEIEDTVVQASFQTGGLYGSVYLFNGDINERGEDDKIDSFGGNLGFAWKNGDLSCDLGMDWLSNMADTDTMGDYLAGVVPDDAVEEYVNGFAGHLLVAYGPLIFFAEYVGVLASFNPLEMTFAGEAARPEAWGVEAGYHTKIIGRGIICSLGYQGTAEALALGLPETRYLASVRMNILENTSLALEYVHDEDYDSSEGGTADNGNTATMQLAVEF